MLSWEDVARRVTIPAELREILGLPVATFKWSKEKLARVQSTHRHDLAVIERLEMHLQNWVAAGPQEGREFTWQVIFIVEERTYIAFIGCDESGSCNMVTVFGTTKTGFIARRTAQPGMVRKRRVAPAPLDEAEIS